MAQHVGRTRQQGGKKTGQGGRQGGRVGVGQHGGRTPTTRGQRRVRQRGQVPRVPWYHGTIGTSTMVLEYHGTYTYTYKHNIISTTTVCHGTIGTYYYLKNDLKYKHSGATGTLWHSGRCQHTIGRRHHATVEVPTRQRCLQRGSPPQLYVHTYVQYTCTYNGT